MGELYHADERVTVWHGDCIEVMRGMADASVDSIVTDPPYGLGFMGKAWDDLPPGEDWARECLRVLKPGGHLLAFGGSRTWHRLAVAVEDAGFEIRDSIAWLYGSGFPKSLDVSKAIDRVRTEDRAPVEAVRSWLNSQRVAAGYSHDAVNKHFGHASNGGGSSSAWMTNPTSRSLPTWDQWQELKSLFGFDDSRDAEVWRLNGRKGPPGEAWERREVIGTKTAGIANPEDVDRYTVGGSKSVVVDITAPATPEAERWSGWGTALKPAFEPVVAARKPLVGTVAANILAHGTGALNVDGSRIGGDGGRWPANVVLDESQASELDEQSGTRTSGKMSAGVTRATRQGSALGTMPAVTGGETYGDTGGASRFFYVAKAPKSERPIVDGVAHPTVKPLALMRWLVRLVTPPGGVVLEPFAGSGTTVEASMLEGFQVIAIERGEEYLPLVMHRIARVSAVPVESPQGELDLEGIA